MWLLWLGIVPQTKRSPVRFPVMVHAWAVGSILGQGMDRRLPVKCFSLTSMFLFLSFSLPFSLKSKLKIKQTKKSQSLILISFLTSKSKHLFHIVPQMQHCAVQSWTGYHFIHTGFYSKVAIRLMTPAWGSSHTSIHVRNLGPS